MAARFERLRRLFKDQRRGYRDHFLERVSVGKVPLTTVPDTLDTLRWFHRAPIICGGSRITWRLCRILNLGTETKRKTDVFEPLLFLSLRDARDRIRGRPVDQTRLTGHLTSSRNRMHYWVISTDKARIPLWRRDAPFRD
jgi:hypothetical protein